jgi:hypothetical protein
MKFRFGTKNFYGQIAYKDMPIGAIKPENWERPPYIDVGG